MSDKVYARVQDAVTKFCRQYGLPPAYLDLTYEALFQLNLEVASGETNPGEDWPDTYLGMAINRNESLPPENGAEYGFKMTRHPANYLFEFWVPANKTAVVPAAPQDNRNDVSTGDKPSNPKDIIGSDKLPLHLWPTTATAMGCLALLEGAVKYGRSNWRAVGVRSSIYYDAALRHLNAWFEGEEVSPDTQTPHLSSALACLAIIVDAQANGKLLDDRAFAPGTGYRELVEKITPHVKALKEQFKDRSPKHYTISDKVSE